MKSYSYQNSRSNGGMVGGILGLETSATEPFSWNPDMPRQDKWGAEVNPWIPRALSWIPKYLSDPEIR